MLQVQRLQLRLSSAEDAALQTRHSSAMGPASQVLSMAQSTVQKQVQHAKDVTTALCGQQQLYLEDQLSWLRKIRAYHGACHALTRAEVMLSSPDRHPSAGHAEVLHSSSQGSTSAQTSSAQDAKPGSTHQSPFESVGISDQNLSKTNEEVAQLQEALLVATMQHLLEEHAALMHAVNDVTFVSNASSNQLAKLRSYMQCGTSARQHAVGPAWHELQSSWLASATDAAKARLAALQAHSAKLQQQLDKSVDDESACRRHLKLTSQQRALQQQVSGTNLHVAPDRCIHELPVLDEHAPSLHQTRNQNDLFYKS